MNKEGVKRRAPMNKENEERIKRRRRGMTVRDYLDVDDFGDDYDDSIQDGGDYSVSDDENRS